MYTTLAEVSVQELPLFLSVFATRGAAMRKKHGSRHAQAFHVSGDTSRIYLLIDWETAEAFERFRNDPEVPPTMKSGGITTQPKFTPLERVAEFPG